MQARTWADGVNAQGSQLWMQSSHAGRQSFRYVTNEPMGPSAVPVQMMGQIATPRALEEHEILDFIQRWARAARWAEQAGFKGAQVHAAHGYLLSSFLSPLANRRSDRWGGSIENRARFLIETVRAIRKTVSSGFALSVKLNSADFQRGGFGPEDSQAVIAMLNDEGIDLLEISGGNYENPAMAKGAKGVNGAKASTVAREAYFLEFAEKVRKRVDVPLMVTGGFRTESGMAEAVASRATDLVGLARPLAVEPDFPRRIMAGQAFTSSVKPIRTGIRLIDEMALMEVSWYTRQLGRMGKGKAPKKHDRGVLSLMEVLAVMTSRGVRTRLRAGE